MKILVCIRQGLDGEINPFDACAYESALQIKDAQINIISMGPLSAKDFLLRLTRLGAERAILLSDKAFAGADTLATAYALALAVKRLKPDLVFCGRQTLVGDTAQTGPMLSVLADLSLITNVMSIDSIDESITCTTRDLGVQTVKLPSLITVERINNLRLPSILSKQGEVEIWSAEDLQADPTKCGLAGSPTRVLKTFENHSGKRKCEFIDADKLKEVIALSLEKHQVKTENTSVSDNKLSRICIVGDSPRSFAEPVAEEIVVLQFDEPDVLAEKIKSLDPDAVLWGSDALSKKLAAQVSAILGLGLCADCTTLETNGEELYMYRPALSGSIIAKIVSLTRPAMATVRTTQNASDIVVSAGWGAKNCIDSVKAFANSISADLATTRKAVDNDICPYDLQVGLTGKTVSPPVYIAVGISGAVHHIVGMQRAGTVIAINPDKNAPIFEYADYGILGTAEDVLTKYI